MLFFTLSPETLKNLFSLGLEEYRLPRALEGFQAEHLSPQCKPSLRGTDQAEDPQGTRWFLSPLPKK